MQKDFRSYTVGELLDLGFKVEVKKHDIDSMSEATAITQMFEGTKQSTEHLTGNIAMAKAWKGDFHNTVFFKM